MRDLGIWALVGVLAALVPLRSAQAEPSQLVWERDIHCYTREGGKRVRVQCTQSRGAVTCLEAPDLDAYGGYLDRTQGCVDERSEADYQALLASGARVVPAVAETPPGYARDESGHAFQTSFDLSSRFYLGSYWAPTLERGGLDVPAPFPLGRGGIELGFQVSDLSPERRIRREYRFLEANASVADLELRGLLFAYDLVHAKRRPSAWVTTFFGEPRVHPVAIPFGWGLRIGSFVDRPPTRRDNLEIEWGELHVSYSPLLSSDLHDYLRFEGGVDMGQLWIERTAFGDGLDTAPLYMGGTAALRGRVTLDGRGLSVLTLDATYGRPLVLRGEHGGEAFDRLRGSVAYEGVLLVINDEPLTARLAVDGATRDDLAADRRAVEMSARAGLRMSFGVPPRVVEPLPELEEP